MDKLHKDKTVIINKKLKMILYIKSKFQNLTCKMHKNNLKF